MAYFDIWRSIPTIDRLFDDVSWTKANDPIYLWDVSLPTAPCQPSRPVHCVHGLNTEMRALRDEVIYNHSDPLPLLEALQNKLQPQLDNPVW